jgi:hypothetical protein
MHQAQSLKSPLFIRQEARHGPTAVHRYVITIATRSPSCAGMLETTRIRREGFSVRLRFEEFFSLFRLLAYSPSTRVEPGPISAQKILSAAGIKEALMGCVAFARCSLT